MDPSTGFFIFYFWVIFSIAIGILGARYNRGGFAWGLGALLLSPLAAAALLLAMGPGPLPVPGKEPEYHA